MVQDGQVPTYTSTYIYVCIYTYVRTGANNDESEVKSRLKVDGTPPSRSVSRRSIIIATTFDLHDASSRPVGPPPRRRNYS